MNILQLGATDLSGQRFNGQAFHQYLLKKGFDSHHMVWQKDGRTLETTRMFNVAGRRTLNGIFTAIEKALSLQSVLYPWSFALPLYPQFRRADVVHYQLLQWPEFFNLLSLPLLTNFKPSVWTIHDSWPLTGHCIQPVGCERWKIGCGKCPDLTLPLEMKHDRTALMWRIKKLSYTYSKLNLVVASDHMLRRVRSSPLLSRFPLEQVPFGFDISTFHPGNTQAAKQSLGIDPESLVLAFRNHSSPIKGTDYVLRALKNLSTSRKVTLLTFNEIGLPEELTSRFPAVELGWIEDEKRAAEALRAADLFIMPSREEGFGMMAAEAMACGKPVVVMEGTPLPEVVGGGDIGFVVPKGDERALHKAISTIIENESLRIERGRRSREFAEKNYGIELYAERMLKIYSRVLNQVERGSR
jgi:glycosyltransferase involved in cell wall biosynthesis